MIEILCIAAEITAVLLILSIAMPASASKPTPMGSLEGEATVDPKYLIDCQDSLLALRSFVYLQASNSSVNHCLRDHLEATEPLRISTTIDSVTRLPNRQELEQLIEASRQWASLANVPTWIGLFQVDQLDQLDDEHGPMASELMLRHVSSFLRERLGGYGPLVRFNHNSLAVALHGWTQEEVVKFLETVRAEIETQVAELGGSTIASTASASVARLEEAEALDALWERLEDGLVEAVSAGANRGRWFEAANGSWQPMAAESHESESAPTKSSETVSPGLSLSMASAGAEEQDSRETALEDDIAALFKAARSQKGPTLPMSSQAV